MTIGSDNPFPSILLAEHVDPATPPSGYWRLFVDTDNVLKLIDDAGTVSPVGGSSGLTDPMTTRGDLIIRNASNVSARLGRGSAAQVLTSDGTDIAWATPPAAASTLLAVNVNTAGGNKTTTSATEADVDATNALVTFTAPASGKVLVRCTSTININGVNANAFFGLRESTTNLGAGNVFAVQGQTATSQELLIPWAMYLTGVSAGSHTYKLAFAVNGGASFVVRASAANPMLFEVWACP